MHLVQYEGRCVYIKTKYIGVYDITYMEQKQKAPKVNKTSTRQNCT